MKTVIQIGSYPVSPECIRGGVEASVYGLVHELSQSHIVDVFDEPHMDEMDRVERYGNLTIHRYTNPGTHNKDAVLRLSEMVRDIVSLGPEVCHIHGTGAFSKQMYFALQRYGIKTIVTVHGIVREEKLQALKRKPSLKALYQYIVQSREERELLNAVPMIIVDTAYVEDNLRAYGLKHMPEIRVIPQGIDETFYSIHCNPDCNVILSVGGIGARKGHILTVEMFNKLRVKGIDAKLHIVGTMTEQNYYELLQKKIAGSLYRDDITLEVNAPREELLKAYAEAKLFVLHSREESQGIVFAEAMATGLPVVATKIGGIPYVVADGKSGLLCTYGDVEAMTDMVEQLMTDEVKWNEFSKAAKEIAMGYRWRDIAERIVELYN